MMWQDFVFMIGSGLSIGFLAPTLRDASARVPLGTSLPSMGIGILYGITFTTLGMSFSAVGAFAAGAMWSLIAIARSPVPETPKRTRRERLRDFGRDLLYRSRTVLDVVPVRDDRRHSFGRDEHRESRVDAHHDGEAGHPAD